MNQNHQTLMQEAYSLIRPYPNLTAEFERSYREMLCNFNFAQFIQDGVLHPSSYSQALRTALEATSTMCRSIGPEFVELAVALWNPMVAVLFKEPSRSSGVKQNSTPTAVLRPDKPRDKKQAGPSVPDAQSLEDALRQALSKAGSRPLIPQHCSLRGCAVCRTIFCNAPITSCQSARCKRRCTTVGWAPHIPISVWKGQLQHTLGTENVQIWAPRLRTGQLHNPLRPTRADDENSSARALSPNEQTSQMDDNEVEHPASPIQGPSSRPEDEHFSWANDTEPTELTLGTQGLVIADPQTSTLPKRKRTD